MLLEATRGCRWRPQSSKNVHHFGMLYIILWIFGYAKSIAGSKIDIRATEAATEAVEATWRLKFGLKCYLSLQRAVN